MLDEKQVEKTISEEGLTEVVNKTTLPWQQVVLALLLAWLLFVALTPQIVHWLNPVTGDEPFYLMTATSIINDHDLDETNNYDQHDYWKFSPSCKEIMQPGWASSNYEPGIPAPGIQPCEPPFDQLAIDLPPHFSKGIIQPGNYTKHGIGLSFLIVPAFALGGRVAVVIFMGGLAALLGVNILLLAWETTGRIRVAWLVWGTLVFTAPLITYAFLIFPAIPAALCIIYPFRRIRLATQGGRNNSLQALATGACIGFLPWLHSLYLSVSGPLFAYWLLGGRNAIPAIWGWLRQPRRFPPLHLLPPGWRGVDILLFFAPLLIFGGLFLSYYQHFYGTYLPNEQDHAGFVGWNEIGVGALGLFFDQKWGLLVYAPVYLFGLSGLALLFSRVTDDKQTRQRRSDFFWLMAIIIPYFGFIARYAQWWGEWCPPARYLAPILPLLALPMALLLERLKGWFGRLLYGFLALWSFAISFTWMLDPKLLYHWQDDQPAKILTFLKDKADWLHSVNLAGYIPSFVTNLAPNKGGDYLLIYIIWPAAFLTAGIALVWLSWRNSKNP